MTRVRWAAVVAAGLLAAGCGSSAGGQQADGGPVKLERIAGAIGCTASVQTDSAELRQGSCSTANQTYVLITFASKKGQRAWLDDAEPYGGSYLVGTRWVVQAETAALKPVQKQLGGAVEAGADHSGH
ncbi:MAG: hypothetical protein QOF84_3970 [Streptomyces sp.]|nr:hypothetical protein [Streptomyces sp.]